MSMTAAAALTEISLRKGASTLAGGCPGVVAESVRVSWPNVVRFDAVHEGNIKTDNAANAAQKGGILVVIPQAVPRRQCVPTLLV